jgi:DNA-binding transcriptional regulator YdaS (Cro superfamily)
MPVPLEPVFTEFGIRKQDLMVSLALSWPAVFKWFNGRQAPSPTHAREIEAKFGIPKHRLRPDLWEAPLEKPRSRQKAEAGAT